MTNNNAIDFEAMVARNREIIENAPSIDECKYPSIHVWSDGKWILNPEIDWFFNN